MDVRAIVTGLALALAVPAQAAREPVLVPDVSVREIEIKYSFTGEDLLLFGAILYPDGRAPDDQRSDIVVVIKGPVAPVRLREKQRVAGVWVNADSVRFGSAPGFYALASSRPVERIVDERTAAVFELGLGNLALSPSGFSSGEQLRRLEAGFVDLFRRGGLFAERENAVEITNGVLYRARLAIPAQVPEGEYTAETYLIRGGDVLAVASRDIRIRKTGVDRFIADAAANWGLLYGIVAITLAVGMGLAAGWWFGRR